MQPAETHDKLLQCLHGEKCAWSCNGRGVQTAGWHTGGRGALQSGANLLAKAQLRSMDWRCHLLGRCCGAAEGPAAPHL